MTNTRLCSLSLRLEMIRIQVMIGVTSVDSLVPDSESVIRIRFCVCGVERGLLAN